MFSVGVRAGVAFVVTGLAIGACGGQGDRPASMSASSCEAGDRYFVFQDPAWKLKEAVDYPDEVAGLAVSEPDLDWYSEHERFLPLANSSTVEGQRLRVSGHEAGAAEHTSQLRGAELTEKQVGGRRALVGRGEQGAPALLTLEIRDDYTLMLLSYELEPGELVEAAGRLDAVCQHEWVDAGGQILDCVPTEPDCVGGREA